jgi:hypothetical protein
MTQPLVMSQHVQTKDAYAMVHVKPVLVLSHSVIYASIVNAMTVQTTQLALAQSVWLTQQKAVEHVLAMQDSLD